MKPIHRDMRGIISIMVLLVWSIWAFWVWLLILLVCMETFMDRKDTPVDTSTSRNRPRVAQWMPPSQNLQVGMASRSRPRKLKFMANRPSPASPRACLALASTLGSPRARAMEIWG